MLLLVLLQPLAAQKPGGGGTGSGPVSRPSRPSTSVPSTGQPKPRIFLSGNVVMEDGSAVPTSVAIERVCGGRVYREAYTTSQGEFAFEVGRSLSMLGDASIETSSQERGPGGGGISQNSPFATTRDESNFGSRNQLFGCELRASASGFRSSTINLAQHQPLDPANVGTIFLQRLDKVKGTSVSVVSLQAPKDARKAYEKGLDAVKRGNLPQAQQQFEKSVQMYPKHAAAWFELGRILHQQNQTEAARKACSEAIAADSKFVNPYLELAYIAAQDGKWPEVITLTDQAMALDPLDYPSGFFLNAVAQYNLGNMVAAESSARRAERLDSQHHLARLGLLMASILMRKDDYNGALERLRNYLKASPNAPDANDVKTQISYLEKREQAAVKPNNP